MSFKMWTLPLLSWFFPGSVLIRFAWREILPCIEISEHEDIHREVFAWINTQPSAARSHDRIARDVTSLDSQVIRDLASLNKEVVWELGYDTPIRVWFGGKARWCLRSKEPCGAVQTGRRLRLCSIWSPTPLKRLLSHCNDPRERVVPTSLLIRRPETKKIRDKTGKF